MTEHTEPMTLAQKKRRPFTIKNGEQNKHIYCSEHPDEIATFYCVKCHKPFGENSVGEEVGEQTICSACTRTSIHDEVSAIENKKRNRRIRNILVGGVTAIVLSVNAFYLIQYSPTSEVIAKPVVSPQMSKLLQCRHHLEALAAQAQYFYETMERLPESIEEIGSLVEDTSILIEPETGKPYLISTDNSGTPKISCPHPEAHGLADLFALPGKPAKMIYKEKGSAGI